MGRVVCRAGLAVVAAGWFTLAASAGLGSVFADSVDRTAMATKLGLRPDQHISFVQAVGYPK